MSDQRNHFGYPIPDANEAKLTLARPIAAAAKERNDRAQQCDTCRKVEELARAQRIVSNWK